MLSNRKKTIPKGVEETKLLRTLSTLDLISLGIGAIVGTGIFTVTGIAANQLAGPALSLSFILAAFAVLLSGLIFAEYASKIPTIGGPYAYMYCVFGEIAAWFAGWLIVIEFTLAGSSVASGWSGYVRGFLGGVNIHLPLALSGSYNAKEGTYIDIIAVVVLFIVTFLVSYDAKKALRLNSAMVALKLFAVVLFIVVGVFYISPSNWEPFMPFGFFSNGKQSGVVAGSALVFFAYLGFETISMAVEEAKEPQKTISRGILGSITIVTVLYVLVTIVLTGMVPYEKLGVNDPVAFAMRLVHQPFIAAIISVIAIVALLTVMISMIYSLSRLVYAISKDGLLPKFLHKVNDKHHMPQNATIVTGIIASIFAGLVPLQTLAELVNIVTLMYLIFMAAGILKIRKMPLEKNKNTFEVPFFPVLPIVSILICGYLMFQLSKSTWIAFAVLLIIGAFIYVVYGYRRSKWKEIAGTKKC